MLQSDLDAISTARKLPNVKAQNEQGYTLLHEAALSCNSSSIWRMSSLININADVNAVAKNGWYPLHIALFRKDTDKHSVIKVLTEANANVNITDTNGQTPLHNLASSSGTNNQEVKELITLLINAKADPNAKDNQGRAPLHTAAANGDSNKKELIVSLINANADPNATDNHSQTPLFIASSSRGVDIEMALITKNANITHQDHNSNTFLHNLFLSLGVFDWSIKIGYAAGQVIQHQPYMLNLANKDGKTPLSCAAFGNKEKQEGESISNLGLRYAAFLIKLAQAKNAAISVSSDELDRLNLALTVSTTLNNTQENQENSNNITTLSLFLAQQLPESLELTGHDDDDYLGVD